MAWFAGSSRSGVVAVEPPPVPADAVLVGQDAVGLLGAGSFHAPKHLDIRIGKNLHPSATRTCAARCGRAGRRLPTPAPASELARGGIRSEGHAPIEPDPAFTDEDEAGSMRGEEPDGVVGDRRAGLENQARDDLEGDGVVTGFEAGPPGRQEVERSLLGRETAASEPHHPVAIGLGNARTIDPQASLEGRHGFRKSSMPKPKARWRPMPRRSSRRNAAASETRSVPVSTASGRSKRCRLPLSGSPLRCSTTRAKRSSVVPSSSSAAPSRASSRSSHSA